VRPQVHTIKINFNSRITSNTAEQYVILQFSKQFVFKPQSKAAYFTPLQNNNNVSDLHASPFSGQETILHIKLCSANRLRRDYNKTLLVLFPPLNSISKYTQILLLKHLELLAFLFHFGKTAGSNLGPRTGHNKYRNFSQSCCTISNTMPKIKPLSLQTTPFQIPYPLITMLSSMCTASVRGDLADASCRCDRISVLRSKRVGKACYESKHVIRQSSAHV
jgi:hypothetical protein